MSNLEYTRSDRWGPPLVAPGGSSSPSPMIGDIDRPRLAPSALAPLQRRSSVTVIGPSADIAKLYERRYSDMVRLAAFISGDVHRAEDLVHEAFIRLVDGWDRLDDPERAEAYLRSTIVNLVRSEHRHRKVVERRSSPERPVVGSAEDDALSRVGRDRVMEAVASLPFRQRTCVVLRFWMRMTESEIADSLGLSVGSVRTHVKRGTATLQRVLGDQR